MTEVPDTRRRGLMLILSSPSGAGKTTIARALLAGDSNLMMSISVTTRAKRPQETDGVDYSFIDDGVFTKMVDAGALLEHARVFDHHYGTPRGPVDAALAEGRDVLFDIDWQGAQQIKQTARDDVASVFILPPSVEELERRLSGRNSDSAETVRRRMAKASDEMSHWPEYDYVIVNTVIEDSIAQARAILTAERLRRHRRLGLADIV
ncbi:MAG: guanylate kinase, partial [Pseudomonadota bacterium]